jgi:hypothetical protein
MKMKKRRPNAAAGGLAVAMGAGSFTIALFSSLEPGRRFGAAATGCMALSWGLKEVAAAKRWKQEPEEAHFARTAEEIRESELEEKLGKRGSMHNVLVLLLWVFVLLSVIAAIGVGYLFWMRP